MSEGSGGEKRASIDSITRALGDEVAPESHAYWQYHYVLTELGHEVALEIVRQVEAVEAAGGMPTQDGSRRRTRGGVFFALAYERLGPKLTKSVRGRATRRFHEDHLKRFLRLIALLLPADPARRAPAGEAVRAAPAAARAPAAKAPAAKAPAAKAPAVKADPEPVEILVVRRRPGGAKPGSPAPGGGK